MNNLKLSKNKINNDINNMVRLERIRLANNFDSIKEFVAVDIETTGLNQREDKILEIAAVHFKDGKMVDSFNMLINPGMRISRKITLINGITNSILKNKPKEIDAINEFYGFINTFLEKNIPFCAHNAKFDFSFLENAFKRASIKIKLQYFDTLQLSRKYLKGLQNHKQDTLESHFGIINENSHRALSDAKSCGEIFIKLSKLYGQNNKIIRKRIPKKNIPINEELQVCAYIQSILKENNLGNHISFYKNNSNYVDIRVNGVGFLKFKIAKRKKYIICIKDKINLGDLIYEDCTEGEGGIKKVRVLFSNITMIDRIEDYIISEYYEGVKNWERSIEYGYEKELEDLIASSKILNDQEIISLLKDSEKTSEMVDITFREKISIEKVAILKSPSRMPLSKIKNNWSKGFDEGFPIYEEGEIKRKAGKIKESIVLFDLSREKGYCSPSLYKSYALAYRKIKDYENEILILKEGIERDERIREKLEGRLNKTVEILYKKQNQKIK